jgi:hypothetical protein
MCNNPLCKMIDIIDAEDGIKIFIHYNKGKEPISITYIDSNICLVKNFIPKVNIDYKNEKLDLDDVIVLDEVNLD